MLVLTRKIGERIIVSLGGETVTIELLKIAGARARVGVRAPLSVAVHRHEIRDRRASAGERAVITEPLPCPSAS